MESHPSPFCSPRPVLLNFKRDKTKHYSVNTESGPMYSKVKQMDDGHLTQISPQSVRTSGSVCSRCRSARSPAVLNTVGAEEEVKNRRVMENLLKEFFVFCSNNYGNTVLE